MLGWVLIEVALATVRNRVDYPVPLSAQAHVAEDQTPTGRFTTATEVKPILEATRDSWVSLREYNEQDLLYATHLLSWRCGLVEIRFAINGGDMRTWALPPCVKSAATPNALRAEDGPLFLSFDLGTINSIEVEIIYDDLTTDRALFQRTDVLTP